MEVYTALYRIKETFIYELYLYKYMRKPITLSIEESLIKTVKKMAIDKESTVSEIIEGWITNA